MQTKKERKITIYRLETVFLENKSDVSENNTRTVYSSFSFRHNNNKKTSRFILILYDIKQKARL